MYSKMSLNYCRGHDLNECFAKSVEASSILGQSEDVKEGPMAFAPK